MIICVHCNHHNSDHASHCEACCSELASAASCPSCGHHHLTTARFCGNCGYLLEDQPSISTPKPVTKLRTLNIPDPLPPEPVIDLQSAFSINTVTSVQSSITKQISRTRPFNQKTAPTQQALPKVKSSPIYQKAVLIHQSTQVAIPLDRYQFPIHLGKPNRKIMPDIDLSTFNHSGIVSRVHADIQLENDQFFIRDSGSANGTFVNNQRIQPGQNQWLESGDKISLGQGDLVTFIFELS